MKNIVVYFLLLAALSPPASSQFNIRNGAQVTTTSAPSLELENMNFVNNGSLSPAIGYIRMTGNRKTQIQGNGSWNLHDLFVNNSTGVTLLRYITVANQLELNGTLFEINNTINPGNNGATSNEIEINRLTDGPAGTGRNVFHSASPRKYKPEQTDHQSINRSQRA